MELRTIVETSRQVGAASGRLEKIGHLARCLAACEPASVPTAVALLAGQPRQGRVGVGWAALRAARAETAASAPSLTLAELDATLDRFVAISGKGAAGERARLLQELFGRATAEEQDFLARLLLGELRQGALEGLMVEAVAKAAALPPAEVRRAVMVAGDVGAVAEAALREGAAGLARFAIALFRPLQPMLAQPAEDIGDALARLGRAALEHKLDGARIQAHKAGDEVRVYSRRLNEVTDAVPEVVEAVQALPARSAILDGEAIALRKDGRPQPFQITMRRFGRRLNVAALREELPLAAFFFDCLALDDEALIDRPAEERFAALAAAAPAPLLDPAPGHRARGRGAGLRRAGAGGRPRGRDGQGDRCRLRGRRARPELAQDQGRAHPRPRGAGRRVGEWPPQGLAQQPAPRRAATRRAS